MFSDDADEADISVGGIYSHIDNARGQGRNCLDFNKYTGFYIVDEDTNNLVETNYVPKEETLEVSQKINKGIKTVGEEFNRFDIMILD